MRRPRGRRSSLRKRLTATLAVALKSFWDGQQGGVCRSCSTTSPRAPYDSTGNATQGRYTVVFRGNWSQTTGMQRTDVPQIELIEVA